MSRRPHDLDAYRQRCAATGCPEPRTGKYSVCSGHLDQYRQSADLVPALELRPTYVPARVLMPTLDEVGTPDMFEDSPELYGELAAEIVADLDYPPSCPDCDGNHELEDCHARDCGE